jgi:hypothetical protein
LIVGDTIVHPSDLTMIDDSTSNGMASSPLPLPLPNGRSKCMTSSMAPLMIIMIMIMVGTGVMAYPTFTGQYQVGLSTLDYVSLHHDSHHRLRSSIFLSFRRVALTNQAMANGVALCLIISDFG